MNKYETQYGTDWESLDPEEAVERGYALGVAASLGEYHPDELDAIRGEMNSAYNTSMVELAFQEGKNEGKELDEDESEQVWNELVVGELPLDQDDVPTGGRNGLPTAIDITDALDRPERDSTDAVDLPEFLQ
ncbi:hypothetical protein GRX03_05545 [Halovenus sp. WSH3]|uniref:Uncharacterized protein n=1 Tax=Halovenus carboxidivorans TaxID=2692199 RepID=A0A6B0T841_9EURY|nr:hypothetical protein [Halovenus carboxidivorans]MXR51070.1 hypothetical protein [Halovenus carboxidivorans]